MENKSEKESPDLNKYREFLYGLAKKENDNPRFFTNQGVDYAANSMSILFEYTNDHVRMYCNGLDPKITEKEEYSESFSKMLDKKIRLDLLVCTTKFKNGKAFQKVISTKNYRKDDTIRVRMATPEIRKKLNKSFELEDSNLSIFDNDKFRLEVKPDVYGAFGSFDDTDAATKLSKRFDDAFDDADDLFVLKDSTYEIKDFQISTWQ